MGTSAPVEGAAREGMCVAGDDLVQLRDSLAQVCVECPKQRVMEE